ncbi:hypothetical protein JXA56_03180 [Candidatus Micrarchaeota archaeon]|nr:hypothetical protein [Candidatus Micrarchaeota archaeon]
MRQIKGKTAFFVVLAGINTLNAAQPKKTEFERYKLDPTYFVDSKPNSILLSPEGSYNYLHTLNPRAASYFSFEIEADYFFKNNEKSVREHMEKKTPTSPLPIRMGISLKYDKLKLNDVILRTNHTSGEESQKEAFGFGSVVSFTPSASFSGVFGATPLELDIYASLRYQHYGVKTVVQSRDSTYSSTNTATVWYGSFGGFELLIPTLLSKNIPPIRFERFGGGIASDPQNHFFYMTYSINYKSSDRYLVRSLITPVYLSFFDGRGFATEFILLQTQSQLKQSSFLFSQGVELETVPGHASFASKAFGEIKVNTPYNFGFSTRAGWAGIVLSDYVGSQPSTGYVSLNLTIQN